MIDEEIEEVKEVEEVEDWRRVRLRRVILLEEK